MNRLALYTKITLMMLLKEKLATARGSPYYTVWDKGLDQSWKDCLRGTLIDPFIVGVSV